MSSLVLFGNHVYIGHKKTVEVGYRILNCNFIFKEKYSSSTLKGLEHKATYLQDDEKELLDH